MGNMKSSGDFAPGISQHSLALKMMEAQKGEMVFSCSFNKWISKGRYTLGYADFTDYTTCREKYRRMGVLVKPDCSNGRYFVHSFRNATELIVLDRQSLWSAMIKLPRVQVPTPTRPTPMTQSWIYTDLRAVLYGKQESSIIGYRDGLAVLQVIFDQNVQSPIFYLLDLEENKCVGNFKINYPILRQWFECYISPNKTRVLLRPDNLLRLILAGHSYEPHSVTLDTALNLAVEAIEPRFRTHSLTFNPHLGDDQLIFGAGHILRFYSMETNTFEREEGPFELPAPMHQIRSSPSGDFVAVRCVSPVHSKEYDINVVVIFDFFKLNMLLKIDARGSYWPVSEVINLQVFPKFSAGESSIAVMKNRNTKRKIYIYKLPIVSISLKQLCRRAILQLVTFRECEKLPLPEQIISFLQWKHK